MRRLGLILLTSGLSALLPGISTAQIAPADTASVPRPFVEGGVYDKPFTTRLLGRTAIGGYAEAHARWHQVDGVTEDSGFQLKRWNLFTSTQVNDLIRIGAELEVEELAEEITLEYAAIDLLVHPSLTIRAGAILSPLGRFNLSHDSPRNEFTDRPLVSTELVGTALTEPGLGALGSLQMGRSGRVTYEAYAVNGFHSGLIDESADGTRIPLGKKNVEDDNASPALVGRLTWSPSPGYEAGFSGHRGAYNVFKLGGEEIEERRNLQIWALDGEADVAGLILSGEAVAANLDIPAGLVGIYAASQRGLYAQAVRQFGRGWVRTAPGSFFEAAARYDFVDYDADLNGDSARRATAGLNFRPSQDAVVKLNYFRGHLRDRFNNLGEEAGFQLSIATYF